MQLDLFSKSTIQVEVLLFFFVNLIGHKGGLALFWNNDTHLNVLNYFQFHIHFQLIVDAPNSNFFFTGFYGHPDSNKRCHSWRLLSAINFGDSKSWCVIGDFNKILKQDEKWEDNL